VEASVVLAGEGVDADCVVAGVVPVKHCE